MSRNLVSLTTNPCKMCMPMGSVTALYGIARCMTILHGSQGCSTYIRRHMATHYNEPVDIASSSLTEQGTVFGGEKNLIQGLENLQKLYHPEVIGVVTTCLAETIGEDLPRMLQNFRDSHPDCTATLIPVSAAGYSGTQFEGFFAALRAVVSHVPMDSAPHDAINVITGPLSPADTRWLKGLLAEMGLQAILLPDLSDNLDGGHSEVYHRLPEGGTQLSDIRRMAGARCTIEIATYGSAEASPGAWLQRTHGVPLVRCPLPTGLRDTDTLIAALAEVGGTVTASLRAQRERYLDAMVDSHKYCAQGRVALFGEPDFMLAAARLCLENGAVPVVAATGAKCPALVQRLQAEIAPVAQRAFVPQVQVADDADFDAIDAWVQQTHANVLLGNSDGRRIAHKLALPLVRMGFPIHDHVGGQRLRMLGYEGSLELLDRLTNALLDRVEGNFREELTQKYFRGPQRQDTLAAQPASPATAQRTLAQRTASHPCFNGCGGSSARIHLPVARGCNIQCNYCVRKYDCPNESRPGVTTAVLTPAEAYDRYLEAKERIPNLQVVGIAGPGDALNDFETTRKTLELVRMADPDVTFCLSTNGLMLPRYARDIVDLGVSHVTVTVNAVEPEIAAGIYHHVDYMGARYTGVAAAAMLLANQLAGIQMLCDAGVVVKVNIVVLRGINEDHIPTVVQRMKDLGVRLTNIMQLIPVPGSVFEQLPLVSHKEIAALRAACGQTLEQMTHCRQCRADAAGTLDNDQSASFGCSGCKPEHHEHAKASQQEGVKPLLVAISSKSGVLVDQHFGHASEFYIYECQGDAVHFRERRAVGGQYCSGPTDCDDKQDKMERILQAVGDCACIVTMRVGDAPRKKLGDRGIRVLTSFGRIEDAVSEAAKQICG